MKFEQIILFVVGIIMLIDSGLFYYASMTQYFLFCASAVLLYVIGLTHILRRTIYHVSFIELLFFTWFVYLIIRGITTNNEQYKLYYLISCYLLFQGISWLFEQNRLSILNIKNLFIGLSVIESVICLLQWFSLIESRIPLFKVSGTWESPNVTAMFIALCIPLLIEKSIQSCNKYRIMYLTLTCIDVAALLSINCRTAYISSALSIFIISGIRFGWFRAVRYACVKKTLPIVLFLSLFVTLGCYGLYKMKQASADGRILIWSTSCSMIMERPIRGYGYGMFEKEYNLYQDNCLKDKENTGTEHENTSHVFVCYNDFLEQGIEGGIISTILYLSILLVVMYQGVRQRDYISILVVGSVIWMSTVNFVIHATPLMFTLLVFMAYVTANAKQDSSLSKSGFCIIALTGVVTSLFCTSSLIDKYNVQRAIRQATNIRKENFHKALDILQKQKQSAGTSECFWRIYGKYLLHIKDYGHAQEALEYALKYTSNPSVQRDLDRCRQKLIKNDK